jgi:putative ABC transport system permease protein
MVFSLTNLSEALGSIRSNPLRTTLTAFIIGIGITALVGILTAIEAIQASVSQGMQDLGSNSFDISAYSSQGKTRHGMGDRYYPKITLREALRYKEKMEGRSKVAVYVRVSFNSEIKYGSLKTNPNIRIFGSDENGFLAKGLELVSGRVFTAREMEFGLPVTVIGQEISQALFAKESPVGKIVQAQGQKFQVIGLLKKTGSVMGGGGADRAFVVPIRKGESLAAGQDLTYDITCIVSDPLLLSKSMDDARGIMRTVRHDLPGREDSFELKKSETLAESLSEVTGTLRIAGFVIGLITLMGASIGLMNIMLVSVTERTHEIGVRKALGATPTRIRIQFLTEAVTICIIGGSLGILLGIAAGNTVSVLMGSGVFVVPWFWIFVGLSLCVAVGVFSGLYPAIKASRLDPVEALRFE